MWVKWLHNLSCGWRSPTPNMGRKLEGAPEPLPSQGPLYRQSNYLTWAVSGVPDTRREEIRSGYLTLAVSGAPM